MPYIGNNHIAGDHTNNFKVLDDISSYTATFDGSASSVVDTTNNTIRVVEHRFIQGQRVTYTNGSGGNIGGLTTGTAYFVIFDSASTIKLATNASNAASSTAINLSAVGTGSSHTLNAAFDGVNTKFKLTHGSGTGARLNNATQINVAINNVLQRPNLDPNNFTDGFALEDNHKIVFQTAPISEDIFWGSIIANTLTTFDISDHKIDTFTGDGSTTEFTLSHTPANNESLMVTINGVLQHPSNASTARAYTLIASIIQFTAAPGVGDEIQVRHMGFAGATTADVSGFYGRTGNVVLTSNDHITTGNINAGIVTATSFDGTFSSGVGGSNANFTGIVTAGVFKGGDFDGRNLNISGIATFAGDVSIGGTLTYEDVTNIDSVGIVTAQKDIHVGAGVSVVGIVTAATFKGDGDFVDIDVDGHTNLDNVSVAGVTTFASSIHVADSIIHEGDTDTKIDFDGNRIKLTAGNKLYGDIGLSAYNWFYTATNFVSNSSSPKPSTYIARFRDEEGDDMEVQFFNTNVKNSILTWNDTGNTTAAGNLIFKGIAGGSGLEHARFTGSGNFNLLRDLDVDGHTNLDNTNIVGVATVSTRLNINTVSNTELAVAGTNTPWRGMFMIKDTTTGSGAMPYMTFWDGSEANDGSNTGLLGRVGHVNGGNVNERFDFWTYRSTTPLSLGTNGNERLRIDTGGRVLIGTPVAAAGLQSQEVYGTSALQIQGTSGATSSISLLRHGNSPYLTLGSTGGSALNSVTALSDDDRIGQITFAGADGTDVNTHAASIAAYVDGSVSSNTVPGRLTFQTSTGASEITRMTITSTGQIGVGVDAPTFSTINSVSGSNVLGIEIFQDVTDTATALKLAADNGSGNKAFSQLGYSGANATAHWANYNTSGTLQGQIVIGSTGKIGINNAAPDGTLHVYSSSAGTVTADGDADELVLESSGNTGMSILSPGTGESSIYFGNPGTNGQKDAWIKYYHETHSTTANRRALAFRASGTERVRIDGSGRLRVASTTESADGAFDDLIVGNFSGNRGISILSANGSNSTLGFAKSGALSDGYIQYYHNSNANSSNMRIKSSGDIYLNDGSADQFVMKDGGNIGINNGSPQEKLQIAGNISLGNRGDNTSRYIGKGTNGSGGVIGDSSANANSSWIGFVSGTGVGQEDQIRFATHKSGTSGGERMRIDGEGIVKIKERLVILNGGNFSTAASQGLTLMNSNIYLQQGNSITWNNGDNDITGVSGYHLRFRTYNGSSNTEKLQISGGSGNAGNWIKTTQSGALIAYDVKSNNSSTCRPAAGDWVYVGDLGYGANMHGKFVVEWSNISSPGCCHHGYVILEAGTSYGPGYDYDWSESLKVLHFDAHNSDHFKAWKMVDHGNVLKVFGQWNGGTVASGTFYVTALTGDTYLGSCFLPATPVVDNNSYDGTRLTIDGTFQQGATGLNPSTKRMQGGSYYGLLHTYGGLDTYGALTTRGTGQMNGYFGTIWCNYGGISGSSNEAGSFTPYAGQICQFNSGNRYIHVKFNIVGGSMWMMEIMGYEYNGSWTSTVNGVSVANDKIHHSISGGYHYNNNALYNGKAKAYRGVTPGWYISGGYICCYIDTNNTGTSNRWGFYKFAGGVDGIIGRSNQRPTNIIAYSLSSSTSDQF